MSAPAPHFTVHDKAYYADSATVDFVRPGLLVKITAASIASDGTIRARFKLTDPKGLPLDRDGVTTPGPVTVRLIAAYIPQGQTQYVNYVTNANGQPTTEQTGPFDALGSGEYQYTFVAKAPQGFDTTVTTTIGIQASRNLTEFDMGTQVANDVFNFVPDGSPVTTVRDVVRTATCNKTCHDPLAVHGGNRREVALCVLCHQPQNVNQSTGAVYDFPVLIHKIHMGSSLPSVKAGGKYSFGARTDFSDVVFPAGITNCQVCHDPDSGAAQANAWLKPNRAACGACHDDVNFATGEGHVNLPQVSDNQCSNCHVPQGELEFDASVKGAHLDPRFSSSLPGTVFDILAVNDGAPGKTPTVTFSIKDKSGQPVLPSDMTSLALVLAGPTSEYTSFVREDARQAGGSSGTYYWTFQNPLPADATGTFSVGIEGYRNIVLLAGTKQQRTVRNAGANKVFYFSLDGSKPVPRRTVVAIEKCDACHLKLEMHGQNRNRIEQCVACHNPTQTDAAGRPASAGPAQSINFRILIHSLHSGPNLSRPLVIYGGSGRPTSFADVRFPGDRRDCEKCHVNGSEQLPLPEGLPMVDNPRAYVSPEGPATAACTACHDSRDAASHALAMTDSLGESCAACHSASADFSVDKVHAR